MDTNVLINYFRSEILKGYEVTSKPDISLNGKEFSNGYWRGRSAFAVDALRKLVELGVVFEPDNNLVIEAELSIPKVSFFCGHELSRIISHYKEAFKKKDYLTCVINEKSLRQYIVKARLELGIKQ